MKREERTAITINKIIELGIEEFGTKGYEGASLNRICEQGIPKGLLYHNFKNKDAVYIACVEKCYKDLTNALKELGEGGSLQSYMQARLHFFNQHINESNIIFETMLKEPKHLTKEIRKANSCFQAFNYAFLQYYFAIHITRRCYKRRCFSIFLSYTKNVQFIYGKPWT